MMDPRRAPQLSWGVRRHPNFVMLQLAIILLVLGLLLLIVVSTVRSGSSAPVDARPAGAEAFGSAFPLSRVDAAPVDTRAAALATRPPGQTPTGRKRKTSGPQGPTSADRLSDATRLKRGMTPRQKRPPQY